MHSILVKDYMDKNPHAIKQNASVRDAIEMIISNSITGAPIIDDNNTLVGFVSEHDCIGKLLNDAFYSEESVDVASFMQTDVKTVTTETSILEVAKAMVDGPIKNYPVIEGDKLVGLISRSHVLNALLHVNN